MKKVSTFLLGIICMVSVANAQDITVFDFDGTTPTFEGGDAFVPIANPTLDGINASAKVGQYTHNAQWNDMSTSVDIDPRVYTTIEMMVYSPFSITGKVQIACFDAAGGQLDWYESAAITTPGVWTKVTRNISFTKKIARVMVGFNRNVAASAVANDNIVYYDNLVFKKSTSPIVTLYNETFYPSWSSEPWNLWTGAPSVATGKWIGGVDLVSTGDIILPIPYDGSIYNTSHVLKLTPSSTDVTISPISNLIGFKNLQLSVGISWPWSQAEEDAGFYASSDEQKSISIKYKTDINNDGIIDINDGEWIALTTAPITQVWAVQLFPLPASTKIIALQIGKGASLYSSLIGSVKIIGEVDNITSAPLIKLSNIAIYPNLATDYIEVKGAQSVSIFNLDGKEVLTTQKVDRIDLSSLNAGVFEVKVKAGGETSVYKLIKK